MGQLTQKTNSSISEASSINTNINKNQNIEIAWNYGPEKPNSEGKNLIFTKLSVYIYEDQEEGGFYAEVSELPGCITQGDSIDEIKENIKDAVESYVETTEDDPGIPDLDIHKIIYE
jgi:predicted RNase H-like HicB family nuclease